MLDLSLLRILKHRKFFFQLQNRVPKEALNNTTVMVMEDFESYFEKLPNAKVVDMGYFIPFFRSRRGSTLSADKLAEYENILPKLVSDVPDDIRLATMQTMLELRLSTEMAETLARYEAGDIVNLHAELVRIDNNFAADAEVKAVDFIRKSLKDIMENEVSGEGFLSRLTCLRQAMRPFKDGDFGIIAARPDQGKTTFLSSEVTHWASQIDPDRNIVWLNNEGLGERIIPRLYQSALGVTLSALRGFIKDGTVKDRYKEVVGRVDRIRVVDIHDMDTYNVENVIRLNNAGVVIFDMIDHIRGFQGEPRTDLKLEQMYKWARTLCVKHRLAGFATSQISADGEGLFYPTQDMLKDSKTGKQGACDFIMMIGSSNDPGQTAMRGIGVPKNKLRNEGFCGDPRELVAFKPEIARFEDIPVGMEPDEDIPEKAP